MDVLCGQNKLSWPISAGDAARLELETELATGNPVDIEVAGLA